MVTVLSSDLKGLVKERLEKRKEFIAGSFNVMVDSYNRMRRMLGSTFLRTSDGTEVILSLPEIENLTPNYSLSAEERKRLQDKLSELKDKISDEKRSEVYRRMGVVNNLEAKLEQLLDGDVLGFILSDQGYTSYSEYKSAQPQGAGNIQLNVYDLKRLLDCLINDNSQIFDDEEEPKFLRDALNEVMSVMMDEEQIKRSGLTYRRPKLGELFSKKSGLKRKLGDRAGQRQGERDAQNILQEYKKSHSDAEFAALEEKFASVRQAIAQGEDYRAPEKGG